MCIYCGTTNYRKIYENHNGPIPWDEKGRKYEIHHIDGNKKNNDPSNLKCVSLQEHYDIHYSQGDWMACHKIAGKLKLSGSEISELARLNAEQQLQNRTHPFLMKEDGSSVGRAVTEKRIENGTHNFLSSSYHTQMNMKLVQEGRHNFSGSTNNQKMLAEGKHPSQNKDHRKYMSEVQKKYNAERVKSGTHSFQKLNSYIWECEKCGKKGKNKANYNRHIASKSCASNSVTRIL
jgi:ribosomal protein L37AE/L43A